MDSSSSSSSSELSITPPSSLSEESLNRLKIIHTLNTLGQSVLLEVYQSVKLFSNSKSIKDHLMQDLSWTESKYKKKFDATMRTKIDTSNPSGNGYDISLLIKCIRTLSEIYEPDQQSQLKWLDELELEGRCKKLKDLRNNTFHSISGLSNGAMIKEMEAIENILFNIICSIEGQFPDKSREMMELKINIKNTINEILLHPLGETFRIEILLEKSRVLLNDEKPHYKERCKEWGKLKVLEFLLGSIASHDIKLLFTEVVVEKSDRHKQNTQIKCTDILKLAFTAGFLLIDSEAGGGKTTIFQFGINDWGEGNNIMHSEDYDFIFPMLFRNPHIRSVEDLIGDLLPSISAKVDMQYVTKCLQDPSQNILFFCDGYDEKNENSFQVFSQICELKKKYPHIRIIVTSRPESVSEIYHVLGTQHSIEHLKVLGIHESKRAEFLERYHNQLIAAGLSQQSTQDLLNFYASCNIRHRNLYRLPINLVILAWIWGQDTDRAKTIKSAAGLYAAIIDILNKKLVSRIAQCHPAVIARLGGIDCLIDLIDSFKEKMYKESFNAVRCNRIYIEDTAVRKLREFSKDIGLPFAELKGAYLLSKLDWENANDLKEILELPHKGFLDYYSAKHIETLLNDNKQSWHNFVFPWQNRIKKIIKNDYGEDDVNWSKYENILQLLGGILALKDEDLVKKHGKDIIEILIKMGLRNNIQWYDVFSDLSINQTAAQYFGELIAPHLILKNFVIRDPELEILSVLLKFVNISKATLDISSIAMPDGLPTVVGILCKKKCEVSIDNVTDGQLHLWNSVITENVMINLKRTEFDLSIPSDLDLLTNVLHVLKSKSCTITFKNLTIKDDHIEILSTHISYANINHVTLDITSVAMPPGLPSLMSILNKKKSTVSIKNVDIDQLQLWKSAIPPKNKINLKSASLDSSISANLDLLHTLRNEWKTKKCMLNFNKFTITDADVDTLSTQLSYVNMTHVTLDISNTVMPTKLPSLIKIISEKQCEVSIKNITGAQLDSWVSLLTQEKKIVLKEVALDIISNDLHPAISSLINILSEKQCKVSIKNITDGQLDSWISLLRQNNEVILHEVELDINSTDTPTSLPPFIDILCKKQCEVSIKSINRNQFELWNSIISQNKEINFKDVKLDVSINAIPAELHALRKLPILSYYKADNELCFPNIWREPHNTGAPDLSRCDVKELWAAVDKIEHLPTSLTDLQLALLVDPDTGAARDPGLQHIRNHCKQLEYLGVHIPVGAAIEHLPRLPSGLRDRPRLYLSELSQEAHVDWAVRAAQLLLPEDRSEWGCLYLPRCGFQARQLVQLAQRLRAEGVGVLITVSGSGPHITPTDNTSSSSISSKQEHNQLRKAIKPLDGDNDCRFEWYEDEERIYEW